MKGKIFKIQDNGFRFPNLDPKNDPESSGLSLSDGMCRVALEYFKNEKKGPLPKVDTIDDIPDSLWVDLLTRQEEVLLEKLQTTIEWMNKDDNDLKKLTLERFPAQARTKINKGTPETLCLIHASQQGEPLDNHHVIAYTIEETTKQITIHIYDPDYPNDDTQKIIVSLDNRGNLTDLKQLPARKKKPLRGFFVI